jgi:hypothetical protein
VTKAVLCMHCSDLVSPYRDWQTDRRWRWCQCEHAAVRWVDGARGLLEITAVHGPEHVRVLGLNNTFLVAAVAGARTGVQWRDLHERTCAAAGPGYLFSMENRDCWALVVAVGESGDVTFVPYPPADLYAGSTGPDTTTLTSPGMPQSSQSDS